MRDGWFVIGGDPNGRGGGIIASAPTFQEALAIKIEAIKRDYDKVQILTGSELYGGG